MRSAAVSPDQVEPRHRASPHLPRLEPERDCSCCRRRQRGSPRPAPTTRSECERNPERQGRRRHWRSYRLAVNAGSASGSCGSPPSARCLGRREPSTACTRWRPAGDLRCRRPTWRRSALRVACGSVCARVRAGQRGDRPPRDLCWQPRREHPEPSCTFPCAGPSLRARRGCCKAAVCSSCSLCR